MEIIFLVTSSQPVYTQSSSMLRNVASLCNDNMTENVLWCFWDITFQEFVILELYCLKLS